MGILLETGIADLSPAAQVTAIIVIGAIAVVAILALFTDFFN